MERVRKEGIRIFGKQAGDCAARKMAVKVEERGGFQRFGGGEYGKGD